MPDTKTHLVTINLMVRGENKTEIDASVHAQLDKKLATWAGQKPADGQPAYGNGSLVMFEVKVGRRVA